MGKSKKEQKPKAPKQGKVTYRKTKPFTDQKEVHGKSPQFFLEKMELTEADGYTRKNIFGQEIVYGKIKFHFSSRRARKSYKHFYIFALVKKDATRYIKTHMIRENNWRPSIHLNKRLTTKDKKKPIIGADLDTAYWNMAYRLGIIKESTYEKGIQIPDKSLGLAALASLGSDKPYHVIRKGEITNDIVIVKGDDRLKEVYKLIRYTCFRHMQRLARLLGPKNYVSYRTDCIYYIDTTENNAIVKNYLDRHDLDFKFAVESKQAEPEINY